MSQGLKSAMIANGPDFVANYDHFERHPGFMLATSRRPNPTGAPSEIYGHFIQHTACKRGHKQGVEESSLSAGPRKGRRSERHEPAIRE